MRGLIVRALKEALMREGQRAATTGGSATIAAFRPLDAAARGPFAAALCAFARRRCGLGRSGAGGVRHRRAVGGCAGRKLSRRSPN